MNVGWIYFGALNCIWASSYFVTSSVTQQLNPILLTWLRLILTALCLAIIYPKVFTTKIGVRGVWLMGASSFVSHVLPFTFLNIGQRLVDPAITTLIVATTPLFVLLMRIIIRPNTASFGELLPILVGLSLIHI